MQKANDDIRNYAKEKNVYLYEVAKKYGINDGNFSRKLRFELDLCEKNKIYEIINRIVEERK